LADNADVRTRTLGRTDLKVSEFGLGCARIGAVFHGDTRSFVNLLRVAQGAGITFFDTADMYCQGESERLIGRTFRGDRQGIVIATKAGYALPARRKFVARFKPVLRPILRHLRIGRRQVPAAARGTITQDFSPAYLRGALEGSLRRLQTDYVDLFQLHSPSLEVVERGEWHDVMEGLKREGKIRHFGVSCDSLDVGLAALRFSGLASLQFVLNLLEPGATDTLLPGAHAAGVGGIARECLANGLLIKDARQIDLAKYCRSAEEEQKRLEQLARVRASAEHEHAAIPRLALRYASEAEGVSVALIGASSERQLRQVLEHVA
jgi:aryl-alcohol dehydrogenase-like predicted oxidoreductase